MGAPPYTGLTSPRTNPSIPARPVHRRCASFVATSRKPGVRHALHRRGSRMTATTLSLSGPARSAGPPAGAIVPNPFRAALASRNDTVYAVELVPSERRLDRIYRF